MVSCRAGSRSTKLRRVLFGHGRDPHDLVPPGFWRGAVIVGWSSALLVLVLMRSSVGLG